MPTHSCPPTSGWSHLRNRLASAPYSFGTVPSNPWQSARTKTVKLDKSPNSVGKSPPRWLVLKSKKSRLERRAISLGMVPVMKRLPLSVNSTNLVKCPISGGIVAGAESSSKFVPINRIFNSVKRPISVGRPGWTISNIKSCSLVKRR